MLRDPADQLLILASDGLWDVVDSQDACTIALCKFEAELAAGDSTKQALRKAASKLTKTALTRGSRDNITVVCVDLRLNAPPASAQSYDPFSTP
jgi:protein phosphatase 2C